MATHPALQGQTKDRLTFARVTWLLMVLFGLIGIATYVAIGYAVYEFQTAYF